MSEYRRKNQKAQQALDMSYGHLQPQATEVEKAVLGALMIDKDAYVEVCDKLSPDSFYEPRNQMVYDAIRQLCLDENPVDMLTVTDKLGKMGKLEEVGGPGYIAELSSTVATSANIEYHANIVAEKYLARQMIHYVSVVGKKVYDESYDIKDVVQEAESTLFELSQKNMKKEYSVISPIVDKAMDQVKIAHSNQGGLTGIILTKFLGQYTRFENDEQSIGNNPPFGGEIRGSLLNGENANMVFSPDEYDPFKLAKMDGYRGDNT